MRTKGARSIGFEARRAALLDALRVRLLERGSGCPSFRTLAADAGVSVATLRHYFGTRDELVMAVLAGFLADGAPHLSHAATPHGRFAESIAEVVQYTLVGLRHGVDGLHAIGLSEGLANAILGPAYVELLFDPTIAAVERRLAEHAAAGEAHFPDARIAAIMLIAPLVIAALRQGPLGGDPAWIDLDALAEANVAAFVGTFAQGG